MANIKVKYLDDRRQFYLENKPVILKYLVYLFEYKMKIPYYENIDFTINGKTVYSGKKNDLDSIIGFGLTDNTDCELIYY